MTTQELLALLAFLLTGAALWVRLGGLLAEVKIWGEKLKDHSGELQTTAVALVRIEADSRVNKEELQELRKDFAAFTEEVQKNCRDCALRIVQEVVKNGGQDGGNS